MMRLLSLVGLLGTAGACSGDGLVYTGEPGRSTAARFDGWVPAVDATVLGAPAASFLVDTGAPLTLLDSDHFGELGAGKQRVELGGFGLTFPELDVVAVDVFAGVDHPFSGIIGGDVLSEFALALDYRGGRAWLDDAWDGTLPEGVSAAEIGSLETIDTTVRGGGRFVVPGECTGGCGTISLPASRMLIEAWVEDEPEPLTLLVDTGASAVVLEQQVIDRLGTSGRPRLDGVTVTTASGNATAYFTRVASLHLGGGAVTEQSVAVLVLPDESLFAGLEQEVGVAVDGLIGGNVLRAHLAVIDYPGRALHLGRYVDMDHIDPAEFVRVGFTMASSQGVWEVSDVYPGTDAAAEGLLEGETVTEIDGVSIAGAGLDQVESLLGSFTLGQEVPVGVERGGGTVILMIAVEDLLPELTEPL